MTADDVRLTPEPSLDPAASPPQPGPELDKDHEIRTPRRWRNLGLMIGSSVVDNGDTQVLSTLFPTLQKAMGLQTSALGNISALGRIAGVVGGPLFVYLARKTNRKVVLAVTSGLWGVWVMAAAFSQNYLQLLILMTVVAVGQAGAGPIVNELFSDMFGDRKRGRAAGYFYGIGSLAGSVLGALIGQLARIENGWRYGMAGIGVITFVFGILILIFFHDPGIGATERQLAHLSADQRAEQSKITVARIAGLAKIPSFVIMMGQRLLSGHLLIGTFGVTFLVQDRGFDNATAALVVLPFGIGYAVSAVFGGLVTDLVHRRFPSYGRVASLQLAQLGFAVVAFFGTQIDWGPIWVYLIFWILMGALQGINPGINRPIVMSVTPPELRGAAFAIMLAIFETIGWAAFTFIGGHLADAVGLQQTFLIILVGLMVVNAVYVSLLYRTYRRDCAVVERELNERAARG
ncbi:MAG TPA: MFS transporter [Microlunatus sp.]